METNISALNTVGTFWIMYNIFALSSLCIWILFIILEIYFLSFRQGYEGDGVRSCEVGFPAIFILPAPARNNIRIYNYSKQILIQNKIVFVPIYTFTTQNLFWNDILIKSETQWRQWSTHFHQDFKLLLQKVFAPWPVVKMHTARLILLNRPHHHHYYIISYLHNKHHHYHNYDKVESGNTIYICSCPHTVQWHQLHHHISTTISRVPQVESNNASCRCPQGYIGDPKVRCQLKTKWYNVNV